MLFGGGIAQSRDAADLLFSSSSARKRHFRLSEVGAGSSHFFALHTRLLVSLSILDQL